jgi:hypothetical protein
MRPDPRNSRIATAILLALLLSAVTLILSAPTAGATSSVVVRGCSAVPGAKLLGTFYSDSRVKIYACGARPTFDGSRSGSGPKVLPYAGSSIYYRGYQCIEIVARYLKARYNADPGFANGSMAVDRYASVYPTTFKKIANGTRNSAPRKGDVLSLSASKYFNDVGHTGIVISSSVNSSGNGSIRAVEQNWGGTGGTSGYHNYSVRSWRVAFAGLPHIKWLRAR